MDYDVIIVGARVAGSSLAILLGRQGRRVLLVDRDRFPSDTLSTHLVQPAAVGMLRQLGALDDVEATGLRRITRQRTYMADMVFEGAMREPPPSYALCPRRDHLDSTLIRHALKHRSVEFAEQTRVEALQWQDGRVTGVDLRGQDGVRRAVSARVVVGADGKYSRVAGWVDAARYHEAPAMRPIYYAYYQGVAPLLEPATEVFFHDRHISYLLPMQPAMDCLILEIQPDDFARFRVDPAAHFEAAIRRLPGMARRLEHATRQGAVLGTRGVENFLRVPYGPGWALAGDAAYCKDPSTGTGIQDAFTQSFLLAQALGDALDGLDWDTALGAYHRGRDDAVLPTYRATLAFTRGEDVPPEALAWLRGVLPNPGLVRALAAGFPAAARSPEVFPPALLPVLERNARLFASAAATPPAEEAAA